MKKFVCREDYPVVQTEAGKLRGYEWDGSVIFKGVKYADAKRFMRPEKVQPWEGIKDANSYGMVCPLMTQDRPNSELLVPHMYWPMDENCQSLNIWTPSIDPEAKRPVMVWLHGGGFSAGSSIEHITYEGANMAKYGDVVVVSLNHRLNVLGYLDLSPFGEKYEASANAGNLDIIAALQWVRDNIRGFGGDPDNVTIFGQSGGGAKVWTLMQMPEADGLFHKGIIESGVYWLQRDAEEQDGREIVTAMLKELGLSEDQVEELETVPYAKLAEAYLKTSPAVAAAGGYIGNMPHVGKEYLGDPVQHGFTKHAKTIPLLIGTALGEFDFGAAIPGKHSIPREEAIQMLEKKYGEHTEELLALYEKAYPGKSPVDLLAVDTIFRLPTIEFIKERCRTPESVTYSYQLTYEFPLLDGKIAWHCSEIPFVFHNTELAPLFNKEGETDKLEEAIFGAWISFAKTGKPVIEGIDWPACTEGDEPVMILDVDCEIRHNVDHELVPLVEKYGKMMWMDSENIQH